MTILNIILWVCAVSFYLGAIALMCFPFISISVSAKKGEPYSDKGKAALIAKGILGAIACAIFATAALLGALGTVSSTYLWIAAAAGFVLLAVAQYAIKQEE